jgi:hypothetical protein
VLVSPPLYQDIEDMAIVIDGPPQIMAFATDDQTHLVQVPLVARSGTPPPELVGIGLPKLPAPIPHRFISEDDATCGAISSSTSR